MSKVRRLAGAANPNYGKAWGNALGGFKNQPRVAGKFATTSQAKAYAKIKNQQKIKSQIKSGVRTGLRYSPSEGHKKALYGATGGVIAAAIIANRLNPNLTISRKRIRVGIRPDFKIGPYHGFTSHDIGIERRGDDAIDRIGNKGKKKVSSAINRVLGENTYGSGFAHAAVGLDSEVQTRGGTFKVDGSGLNRRVRYERNGNKSVPGAPATKDGKVNKPQGTRKGGAKTITNTSKGGSGQVKLNSRPQRRGGGKKKKSKKGTITK